MACRPRWTTPARSVAPPATRSPVPVDRRLAESLARQLTDLYRDLETQLAHDIARRLRAGVEQPDWAARKLAALGTLRAYGQRVIARLETRTAQRVEQLLVLAYIRGGRAGLDELFRLGRIDRPTWIERLARLVGLGKLFARRDRRRIAAAAAELADVRRALPGVDALQQLAFAHVSLLRGTHLRILRWQQDVYRETVAQASAPALLGMQTRLQLAQTVWDRLLAQGVTGFVDRAGRNWELASYVEMATRTVLAQAATQAHLDQLQAQGVGLVIVSDAPQECALCRPWEGKVLAIAGPPGPRTVQAEHGIHDGVMVDVHIAGTVAEAIAAGLMHPNCRHSLSAYLPGVTKPKTHTADPDGDQARQRQRAIERQIRRWKLRADAALTPAAAKSAQAKVRAWQARLREHLAAHPELRRQPPREQIGAAR